MNFNLDMIFIAVIAILAFWIALQHERINTCKVEIAEYQSEIGQMEIASKRAWQRTAEAEMRANRLLNGVNTATKGIMATPVSPDCQKALLWAVSQAEGLK